MKLMIISLGCSKNLVDSENYLGMITKNRKITISNSVEEADICIINTCGFIGDAKKEAIDCILEIAEEKKHGNLKKIVVTGCLAQKYAEELLDEVREIDAIIGTGEIDKIEQVIDEIFNDKRVIKNHSMDFLADSGTPRVITTFSHSVYLKISEGCNRKCAYCIIPSLRGKLRSRTIEDIVIEAKNLVKNGAREINLLAQETTEYGIDLYKKKSLANLMRELVKIKDLKWIRSYYMFPNSITDDLIYVMKTEDKICNYFDIPIQHISNSILKNMKRGITGDKIKELLYKIRKEIPDAVFRTSIIVGFPGETEEEFLELKEFIKEFKFDYIGIFKYSKEEDTVAFNMKNQVLEDTKEKRWGELSNIQGEIAKSKNMRYIGKEIEVMIDGVSEESEHMLEGRTRGQALEIDGKVLTNDGTAESGEIVKVKIEQNFDYDLLGPIVKNSLY